VTDGVAWRCRLVTTLTDPWRTTQAGSSNLLGLTPGGHLSTGAGSLTLIHRVAFARHIGSCATHKSWTSRELCLCRPRRVGAHNCRLVRPSVAIA